MHRKMLEDATHEHLHNFISRMFEELKEKDHEMYEELEEELYKDIYGCHFNEWLLEKALKRMHNEDGTMGGHWTIEQTTEVAKQHGIEFENFNKYDWNYVMNMIYSDYYGAIPNELSYYVKMAKKFLEDKDAERGKAYHYYTKIAK
jgi:hypothetical protein